MIEQVRNIYYGRIVIFFILMIICTTSCSFFFTTKKDVQNIEDNFRKKQNEFVSLTKWIENYEYYYEYPYHISTDRHLGAVIIPKYDPGIPILDNKVNQFIQRFLNYNNLHSVTVYEDVIWFNTRERNVNLEDYRIGYFRTTNLDRIKGYKKVASKEKPIKETGWVYKIKDDWYLENRFPKKDITDSLRRVQGYNQNYLKTFRHSFKGVIVEKKRIKNQSRESDRLAIIKVKLQNSSVNYYDPRDSLKYYFCLIDYPYLEAVYKEGFLHSKVGDTCIFNHHKFITEQLCVYKNNGETLQCTSPEVMNNNIDSLKHYLSIPQYTKQEKDIKREGNKYKRNKNIYRFYLGKYKTKSEYLAINKKYRDMYLLGDCFKQKVSFTFEKGDTKFLFHRLTFYNLKHMEKYMRLIDKNIRIGVFNKDDQLLKIYKVQKRI